MDSFEIINQTIMVGTLVLHALVVVLLLAYLNVPGLQKIRAFVAMYGITLSVLLVFGAVVASLYYSSIANFTPCVLCWYQRIFIYPQLVLFVVALARKTRDVLPYTIALSIVGGAIAVYQVIIERLPTLAAVCAPDELATSCGTIYVEGFNYITIPVMGLTIFVLLLLVAGIMKKEAKKSMLDRENNVGNDGAITI